jgi:phage-related minor tail protein
MAQIKKSDIAESNVYGDITKSLDEYTKAVDKSNKILNKQADSIKKVADAANPSKPGGINQIIDANRKLELVQKKAEQNDKKKLQAEKALQKARLDEIRLQKQREQAFDRFEKQRQREVKQGIKARQETLNQNNAYKQLTSQVNSAQARFKRLAAQYGATDKRAVKARKTFERLDDRLRKINNSVRDGRRDVGRYGLALNEVKTNVLGLVAAGTGLIASFRGVFNIANEQDKLNKRIAQSFNLQGEALKETRKQVGFLAQAYDKDVNEVVDTATALTNEFNISQTEAFNIIEKGFAKGADVRGEFLEQLKEYATQFVNVGLSADEAIAVITQQEN